ncbi:MAG: hypothetical protein KF712_12280 [Akkermansiaceae bacterium]|nr:hypothetical protein [Akkermansiaceae bacterium]
MRSESRERFGGEDSIHPMTTQRMDAVCSGMRLERQMPFTPPKVSRLPLLV